MKHARDPIMKDFSFEAVYRTDVTAEQRGLENIIHNTYNPPLGAIPPISPKNPRLAGYMRAAEEFLKKEGGGG
ncbi:hypothetical protein NG831_12075 [Xanthomonas sacchari]|uniref:hypothetical protein n=1 Tax=Xanthomonas sacchari TaxID=56458 RepID=UPI0022504642|nr:hypothetical protein [Xanthomonas sacchari]UYK64995.1 hypothetical protein NG831_12075 [Xanthomonas sacchari]